MFNDKNNITKNIIKNITKNITKEGLDNFIEASFLGKTFV